MAFDIKFKGEEQATKTFLANASLRYLRLSDLESWAEGSQYDGQPSWWSTDVPLWERAPCVVYPIVDIAARSNVDLCLGEGRFPIFTTKPGEDEGDDDNGLNEADSQTLDRFIREHHKICKFKSHSREAFYSSETCGSAVAIHGVRNGRPFVDSVPARWCTPTFDSEGAVTRLEIKYPYIEEYKDKAGNWAKRTKIFKRVIDQQDDTEYFPADGNEQGIEPSFKVNVERSFNHALGFCPVIWYALMKGCTTVNVIDGKALHDKLRDEIRAHDIARSQWHRGALFSEPQICEIGVPPGYNPTGVGRTALVPQSDKGNESTSNPATKVTGFIVEDKPKPARIKGPGSVWQYTDHNTRVELLEYPEGALASQENNCRDLRVKLQESLAVVFLDPENIKFAVTTSGKALEAIKQKQLDRCDQFRDDLSDNFFHLSLSMQLRIVQVLSAKGKKLKIPGVTKVIPILDKCLEVENDGSAWQMPTLKIEYGPYFRPDPAEELQIVNLVQAALGKATGGPEGSPGGTPLITQEIAIRRVAKIFGIENIKSIVDALEKQKLEAQKQQQKANEQAAEHAASLKAATTPTSKAA